MLPKLAGSSLVKVPCRTIVGLPAGVVLVTEAALAWPVDLVLDPLLELPAELWALRGWLNLGDGGETLPGVVALLTCLRFEARVPRI